jgi:arylsulfatase A-like enzyme
MRPSARALPIVAASWLAACGPETPQPPATRLESPPVVLIVLDALHAEHLSHLGNERETTPVLDALAAEGVTFEACFAPAPYTSASIPSILTGRLPDRHGVVDRSRILPEAETTIAEVLAAAGYETFGAVGNLNGSSLFGCDQGFDNYVEVFRAEDGRSVDAVRGEETLHVATAFDFPPVVAGWLEERDPARPPFLYLHVLEPHEPYAPPQEYRDRFLAADSASELGKPGTSGLQQMKAIRDGGLVLDDQGRAALEALYDANLAFVDQVVGQLLGQLRGAGLYDDALILVTSDHGEAFWQHGELGHNTTLYDEMLHVPLIVKLPGEDAPRGLRVGPQVSVMDLFPSLCEWLDLPAPAVQLDGVSLTPYLRDPDAVDPGRLLVMRTNTDPPDLALRREGAKTIVLRPQAGEEFRVEHYLLDEDPDETRDLGQDPAEEDLRWLWDWNTRTTPEFEQENAELSDAESELMDDLGYAE